MLGFKICLFALAMSVASSASAFTREAIGGISRTDVIVLFTGMGMKVDDKTKDGELPWLVVESEDRTFNVFLYQCGSDAPDRSHPCTQIRFKLFWDNDKKITLATINKFNLDYVFGRAFVTEDASSVGVDYAIHLEGGSTRSFIRENVKYFLRVVNDFETEAKP